MNVFEAVDRVGEAGSLDQIGVPLTRVVKRIAPPKTRIKDLLSGTWLGHPLHPLLTDIPIGSFTGATVLDLVGGRRSRWAADRLLDLGVLSALPTALAGAADWSDTYGEEMRVGVVHALANVAGVGLYAASAVLRRGDRRNAARALGLAGMAVMSVGGYLGGHLS